jgi:hypothetical protein
VYRQNELIGSGPFLQFVSLFIQIAPLNYPRRKKDPHIRIMAGFLGSRWGKLGGEIHIDLRAFSGLWARCKSALFWQTER